MMIRFRPAEERHVRGQAQHRGRRLARVWPGMVLACLMVLTPAAAWAGQYEPLYILLTWQRDPTRTMTIDWQTEPDEQRTTVVQYQVPGDDAWQQARGSEHPFPHSDRTIHRVELVDLDPGTTYRFRLGEDSRTFKFRTMPADLSSQPIRFAAGGDTGSGGTTSQMNRMAASHDVDFIVWGGDLAYADGKPESLRHVNAWFRSITRYLITDEGRLIPVVVGIGNHEMHREAGGDHYWDFDNYEPTDAWRLLSAPYFFGVFAFPGQPGYGVLDFGDYLSLVILDSAHANPIEGEQTQWLEQVLAEREEVPHVFPVYHVPAYPSVRSDSRATEELRRYWVPLFERYGVRVAFENHDHAYKRTHPLLGGEIHPHGIVYIGDGAWGVSTRTPQSPEDRPYLKRAEEVHHGILVTIQGSHQHLLVIDPEGNVVDEYPPTPHVRD